MVEQGFICANEFWSGFVESSLMTQPTQSVPKVEMQEILTAYPADFEDQLLGALVSQREISLEIFKRELLTTSAQ